MLDGAKQKLLKIQEQLGAFRMDVELREPLPEELDEMREFVRERAG